MATRFAYEEYECLGLELMTGSSQDKLMYLKGSINDNTSL